MIISNFNFLIILFFLIFYFFLINFNNTLQSLIVSEFVWITLYIFTLLVGFSLNDLNLISLSLFFLVFSALEISIGLVLNLIQQNIFKTLNTSINPTNNNFFSTKSKKLFLNKKLF